MTLPVVINPFDGYLSLAGAGLNAGSLYIGVAGSDPQSSPQACFWDAAGTIPATQPIAILGGYPMRLGSPAQLFTAATYSIRIRDAQGVQVFYVASVSAPTAANLNFTPGGTGPITRAISAKLDELVSTADNDTIQHAIAQAFATGATMVWPAGSTLVTTNIPNLFDVAHLGRGSLTDGTSVFYPDCHQGITNTLHVKPDTGSDSNDGISASRALLTVNEALARISKVDVGQCNWTIQIYTCTPAQSAASEPITITINSDAFRRLTIKGIAPTTTTFLGTSAQTGVDGAYDLTLIVGSTAGMAVGNYLGVEVATGPTYYETWQIGARILQIIDATHVKVRSTAWYGAPPVAAGTGTVYLAQTHLAFTGVTGIYSAGCTIKDVAIVGNLTVGTFGLLAGNAFGIQNGETYCDGCIWTVDFGDDGARCDGAELVFLSTARHWSHNNGDNGKQVRGCGNQRNFGRYYGVGNGWQQITLSAGNGTMAQQTGAAYEFYCYVAGNWGIGSMGRTGGNIIHDNGGIVRACRNYNDYKAGPGGGSVQALNGYSRGSHQAGYHVEGFGTLLVNASSSTDAGTNAYENIGGFLFLEGSTITNPTNNGVAATGSGARTAAAGANVVSLAGGGTPYIASQGGWIDRTGATGLTTSSADGSGVNTLGSLGSLIIA